MQKYCLAFISLVKYGFVSPPSSGKQTFKRYIGLIGLLLLGMASLAMLPMLLHNYPITHSTQFNLSWIFQYQRQFWGGQFYPRWLEFSNFGFGNPTFVFYPPMLAIATLPFSWLGWDLPSSLVSSMVLAAFVLASGVYLYANLYFPSWLAIAISGLAIFSPYFLIDIYQRGAIAEVWAITFIPWILLATNKLIAQIHLPQWQRSHAISLAIAWGMLGLSHLPTLLITFLAWIPMPLYLLKNLVRTNSLKSYFLEVGRCYLSAILGFLGISFFLLPVILDQKLVQVNLINFSPEYLPQNRLLLRGLLSLSPQMAKHWFESGSGMIPYFWILLIAVLFGAILLGFRKFKSANFVPLVDSVELVKDRDGILWVMANAIALLMTTDLSVWIYQLLPTLQKIQFSWRWYGLTVTTIPLLIGWISYQLYRLVHRNLPNRSVTSDLNDGLQKADRKLTKQKVLGILISSLWLCLVTTSYISIDKTVMQKTGFDSAIITNFARLASQKEFPQEPDASGSGTPILWWHWIFSDGLGIVDVPEYRAKGVTLPMPPHQSEPLAAWQTSHSEANIQIKQWKFGLREILVDNQSSEDAGDVISYMTLRMLYYPAWQVWIDGKTALLEATSEGQSRVAVPNGSHLILVKYVGTQSEHWGQAISWLMLIMLMSQFVQPKAIATD
ncbi:MAG: hypothetical protein DCE90_03280 [Pseudanabaena sp.]|nr:MAG: hypothetical protein DCE90_03280 [Pseudanabaena sp.]